MTPTHPTSDFSGPFSPVPVRNVWENKPTAELSDLQYEIERLLILTEALWNILRQKHGVDEEELVREMVQIDLRDGKLDGRVAKGPPAQCPKCKRPLGRLRVRCLYCGEPIAPKPFER